jgi:hypothetical protein
VLSVNLTHIPVAIRTNRSRKLLLVGKVCDLGVAIHTGKVAMDPSCQHGVGDLGRIATGPCMALGAIGVGEFLGDGC